MRFSIIASLSAFTLFCVGCSTSGPEPTAGSHDQLNASWGVETVRCVESFIDHGATVTFHAEPDSDQIYKAVYSETSFSGTDVIVEMGACRKVHVEGPVVPDMSVKTHTCNDVSFIDGYEVSLFEGGLTGTPSIALYKMNASSQLVPVEKTFSCSYVAEAPAPACDTAKIEFSQSTGCVNDGSIEFCVPASDVALQERIKARNPSVGFRAGGGRARCNSESELLGTMPTKVGAECVSENGALTSKAWADICSIASEPAVRKIVPTFFE